MGIIVHFEGRREGTAQGAKPRPTAPCEIIILPCVRYERCTDEPVNPKPQRKKARRRGVRPR